MIEGLFVLEVGVGVLSLKVLDPIVLLLSPKV